MSISTREGYIGVKGGKAWYHISGRDKRKPPLLALHGGPGAPHYYLEVLETLPGTNASGDGPLSATP